MSANRTVTVLRSSLSGGAVCVPPGTGAPSSREEPQELQKRAAGGASAPQEGQTRASREPQPMQKAAPSGFSALQLAQFAGPPMNASSRRPRPVTAPYDVRSASPPAASGPLRDVD